MNLPLPSTRCYPCTWLCYPSILCWHRRDRSTSSWPPLFSSWWRQWHYVWWSWLPPWSTRWRRQPTGSQQPGSFARWFIVWSFLSRWQWNFSKWIRFHHGQWP
jgi:hypothetical protein